MRIPQVVLRILLILTLIVAVVIRIQNIKSDFFYDEIVYVNLAKNLYKSDFYSDFIFVRHPPLYWFILRFFALFGDYNEALVRSVSIAFSVSTIVITYALGTVYRNEELGLASSVLVTFSTIHQQYSQAATMFSLVCFLFTLSVYAIKIQNRRLMFVSIILVLYTSYFGFFLLLAIVSPGFFETKKLQLSKIKHYLIAYLPWIGIAVIGISFQVYRLFEKGTHQYSFTPINFIFHLSIVLFIGLVYFSIQRDINEQDKIIVYLIWLFLLISCFMMNYERYILPLLPTAIVLGLVGIEKFVKDFRSPVAIIISIIGILCFEGYGIYPYSDQHLDERDMIQKQEWSEVCNNLTSENIVTTNARGIIYYSDLEDEIEREREDYGEIFRTDDQLIIQIYYVEDLDYVLEKYNIKYLVFQKNEYNYEFIEEIEIEYDLNYTLHHNFDNTIIFKKK